MPRKPKQAAAAAPDAYPEHCLVEVTWEDASFDLDKEPETAILRTVGFLIRWLSGKIVIAGEGNVAERYFRSYTTIPNTLIQQVRRLK